MLTYFNVPMYTAEGLYFRLVTGLIERVTLLEIDTIYANSSTGNLPRKRSNITDKLTEVT